MSEKVASPAALRLRRRVAKFALRALVPLSARVHVQERQRLVPPPALVAANHLAHFDPLILLHALPGLPEFMALADLWRLPWLAPFLRLYAPIPVRRDRADRSAIRRALAALRAGAQVVIFPEARISPSGRLEPARAGVGYLALKAGVPVQPVALWGTERLLAAWRRGRRGDVHVRVGHPVTVARATGRPITRAERAAVTEHIMARLARLLPPAYRGAYGHSPI